MTKSKRNRRMRGGLWNPFASNESTSEPSSSSTSSWNPFASSSSESASSWNPFASKKNDASQASSAYQAPSAQAPSAYQAPQAYGGKKRRKMRGGYSANMSHSNLASHASPFSGSTARAQAHVGGRRTKRRCHKHKRTHRRHCRK